MDERFSSRPSIAVGAFVVLVLVSLACGSTAAPPSVDVASIQTAAVKTALAEIQGAKKPAQQAPSNIQPTANVAPTLQPPTPPEPSITEPTAVKLSGSGDSVQDVSAWPPVPGLMIVEGNAASRFFAISPYDQGGNRLLSSLSSTDPYKGMVAFNFDGDHATRLEIKATDAWTIQIVPLSQARTLGVPGTIQGTGDEVIVLTGAVPDTATVTGNSASRFFAVIPYDRNASRLLSTLMTTDPYSGTVMMDRTAAILEIKAIGDWSIAVTAPP